MRAGAQAGDAEGPGAGRVAGLVGLALLIMTPVTLPVPVLREFVQERFGVSELLTSLFMSVNMLGAALSAPLAGALADRFGHRQRQLAAALALDGLLLLSLRLPVPFPVFMGLRLLEGCAHILALSMLLSLASSLRAGEASGRVMGLVGGAMMLGVAIGAPLGGVLGREDPLRPLAVGGALALLGALLAAAILRESLADGERRPGLREIARLVRRDRLLWLPLAFAFADRFTVGFFTTTFSLYLRRIHDVPASRIGLLIAVFMLPFALLSYPAGRLSERVSRAVLLCGGSLVYGVGTASLGFWPPGGLAALMLGLGTAAAAMFVPSLLMTLQLSAGAVRSTAIGAFNAAGSLGFIAGPVTGGFVTQWVAAEAGWEAGYRAAFAVAGASEVALALLAFWPLWRRERAGTGQAPLPGG